MCNILTFCSWINYSVINFLLWNCRENDRTHSALSLCDFLNFAFLYMLLFYSCMYVRFLKFAILQVQWPLLFLDLTLYRLPGEFILWWNKMVYQGWKASFCVLMVGKGKGVSDVQKMSQHLCRDIDYLSLFEIYLHLSLSHIFFLHFLFSLQHFLFRHGWQK